MLDLPEFTNWRKISDELPPEGESVLFSYYWPPGEDVAAGHWKEDKCNDTIIFTTNSFISDGEDPIYWCPIPK